MKRTFLTSWSGRAAMLLPTLLVTNFCATAQWLSQSINLKTGWNAVYLHVDASHDSLPNLVGADPSNPIIEVWRWLPDVSTAQFVQSPAMPVDNIQWESWSRNATTDQLLQRLVGNSAYLVRSASNYTWTVKGKPLAPTYDWTTTGLNFLGFPTVPSDPPTFENFLAKVPELQQNGEFYYYPGGELGTNNPAQIHALRTFRVNRGQAYWIRSGTLYNRYFAPFELLDTPSSGFDFGTNLSTASLRLRNLTTSNLTVSLQLVASEAAPAGQTAIAGVPPLLLRGAINITNLTYGSTNLTVGSPCSWTLSAKDSVGSEVEVFLGLNRAAITNATGTLLAGVLRFSDALGFCQVDAPVSANPGSTAGLWVGVAAVTQVGEYLKTYARGAVSPIFVTNGTSVVTNDLVFTNNSAYVVTGINTNLGSVPRAYPLRLIIHNPADSSPAQLLQRVYCGLDPATNFVVATAQSVLNPAALATARRISAVHLPWSAANTPWTFSGNLGGGTITATITHSYRDRASNPFIHGYHPDHDNLDSTFKQELPQGSESYTIERQITLQVTPSATDFASLTAGNQNLTGTYLETIRLLGLARAGGTNDTRSFQVAGGFSLQRISEATTLTTP